MGRGGADSVQDDQSPSDGDTERSAANYAESLLRLIKQRGWPNEVGVCEVASLLDKAPMVTLMNQAGEPNRHPY